MCRAKRRIAPSSNAPRSFLTRRRARLVERAIRDHCLHRGWTLRAINVRSNHVHVVVLGADLAPEPIMKQLKDWATRRLREAEYVPGQGRVWTAHGSTRYLFTVESVEMAADYVINRQ
ncbi:MAG: transposase [Phycisphaerales bacterium JB039]